MKRIDRILELAICFMAGIILGCFFYHTHNHVKPAPTRIDSLITVNDSIKVKVEKLDSIKNAKIIEIGTFDNDSTLKLFYKLVSE